MSDEKTTGELFEVVQQRGTYHVSVMLVATSEDAVDGSTDMMRMAFWPGTKEGGTPPAMWEEAFVSAVDLAKLAEESDDGLKVAEIRISTFHQGSPADPLTQREEPDGAVSFPTNTSGGRVRPILWVCEACNVGVVRVFLDEKGDTTLLWEGPHRPIESPALLEELNMARMFYAVDANPSVDP